MRSKNLGTLPLAGLIAAGVGTAAGWLLWRSDPAMRGLTENQRAQVVRTVAMVKAAPTRQRANADCHVCHLDFAAETLAATHEKAKIGCARCHGNSEPHSSDENGITPPQVMFPKAAINATCLGCHDRRQLRDNKKHKPVLASKAGVYCTDCHGREHRAGERTRQWDKWSGKLIKDDGVRMVSEK